MNSAVQIPKTQQYIGFSFNRNYSKKKKKRILGKTLVPNKTMKNAGNFKINLKRNKAYFSNLKVSIF